MSATVCPDLDGFQSRERYNVAGQDFVGFDAIQAIVGKQFRDAGADQGCRCLHREQGNWLTDLDTSPLDAPDRKTAEVGRIVDRRDQHLERRGVRRRGRHL